MSCVCSSECERKREEKTGLTIQSSGFRAGKLKGDLGDFCLVFKEVLKLMSY